MKNLYKRHRFPPAIVQYAVWLYNRFNLGIRDVEDLLAERGNSQLDDVLADKLLGSGF